MRKILLALLICTTAPAYAFNMGFLAYSPAYYFSKADWKIMEKTANEALDNGRDDVKQSWKNPGSTAYGWVIPSKRFQADGLECRNLTIFNSARQVTDEVHYRFCKADGAWKVR
jgi:surface antigen